MSNMRIAAYKDVRSEILNGDMIAFGGHGLGDLAVRVGQWYPVSHVAPVLQMQVVGDDEDRHINFIVEAILKGVRTTRLSDAITDYKDGRVYWFVLNRKLRAEVFNSKAFFDFLLAQAERAPLYDFAQAIKSQFDRFDKRLGWTYNEEDFIKMFCSEVYAACAEVAGMTGRINASEVTPENLCQMAIWEPKYVQLAGEPDKELWGYNTRPPSDWDV